MSANKRYFDDFNQKYKEQNRIEERRKKLKIKQNIKNIVDHVDDEEGFEDDIEVDNFESFKKKKK